MKTRWGLTDNEFNFCNDVLAGVAPEEAYSRYFEADKRKAHGLLRRQNVKSYMNHHRKKAEKKVEKEIAWEKLDAYNEIKDILETSKNHIIIETEYDGVVKQTYNDRAANTALRAIESINKLMGTDEPEHQKVTLSFEDGMKEYSE